MTAPSPDAFDQSCRALIAELQQLRVEFRWAHGAAYSPQVVESVSVTSGPSNPTKASAFDHVQLKAQLTHAAVTVRASMKAVTLDVDKLKEKMLRDERPHGVFDPVRNPRSLDPMSAEHEQLREAQARRRARGEEVGVGDSPSAKELDPTLFGSRSRRPR